MTRVLGIDPGLASAGWGIVERKGSRFVHVAHDVIKTTPRQPSGERLLCIHTAITDVIREYSPDSAAIEMLYFARNATSAIPVAQARGVLCLALAEAGLATGEYPPQAIKQAIVGHGRAEKSQVQELVRVLLGLSEIPRPDHAADALAAAICHLSNTAAEERLTHV